MKTAILAAIMALALALIPAAAQTDPKTPAAAPAAPSKSEPGSKAGAAAPKPADPGQAAKPSFGAAPPAADPGALAAPKAVPGAKPAGAAPVDDKSYIIGAQDQLAILVAGEAQYATLPYIVRPDGKISLPGAGEMVAAGKTPEQLGLDIAEKLKDTIREPMVTVSVTAVRSRKYYIHGEVLKPGEFDLITPTTVLEGLVQAGGFREFANQKNIIVNRANGTKILKFNYKDVIQGKHREQNVLLEPGDIIVVK